MTTSPVRPTRSSTSGVVELGLRPGRPRDGRRSDSIRPNASPKLDKTLGDEIDALRLAYESLSDGRPLYRAGLTRGSCRQLLAPYFLLTNRRVLAVVNVGEDALDDIPAATARVEAEFNDVGDNVEVVDMCVQLEAEAASITDPSTNGPKCSKVSGSARAPCSGWCAAAYHLLGLRTFLTTGEKEDPGVDVLRGFDRPGLLFAGRIHTDFQRGFIRAEVIQWDELLQLGSWNAAKGSRQAARRRQGLRRSGRRRDGVPLQRVTWAAFRLWLGRCR